MKINLQNKEWKVYLDELGSGQFHVARLGGIANYSDPTSFLDLYKYTSSGHNFSGWTYPEYTKLLEAAENTADSEKRLQILRQAEEILMREMPIAPIYYYTGSYLKRANVKGFYLSELSDIDFKWAYVEN